MFEIIFTFAVLGGIGWLFGGKNGAKRTLQVAVILVVLGVSVFGIWAYTEAHPSAQTLAEHTAKECSDLVVTIRTEKAAQARQAKRENDPYVVYFDTPSEEQYALDCK
jgi:hypothetical protein